MLKVSEVTILVSQVKALSKKIDGLSLPKSATIMVYDTYGDNTQRRLPDRRSSTQTQQTDRFC